MAESMAVKDMGLVIENALSEIESAIDNALTQEKAIALASYYGLFAICNFAHLYDGGHLERKFINRFDGDIPKPRPVPSKENIHVISRSYKAGGHIKLMERLAGMHESLPDLLITQESNIKYSGEGVASLFGAVFNISDYSFNERLRALVSIYSEYKNVVLHIHPNDFIAAVAARIAKRNGFTKVYFVNHADHLFSFGRTAADCVLEVSAFGEALGKAHCPGLVSSFIGIPLPANWSEVKFNIEFDTKKSILTSGASWKFKPELGLSLPIILQNTLRIHKNIDIVILGVRPFRDYWWWVLKVTHPSRVTLRNSVPFLEYKKILNSHFLVLDSFPITGGTAFPEAIINGKIAIAIDGPVSGYSPADQLRGLGVQAIESAISDVPAYKEKLERVLKEMERVHGMQYVKERFISALTGHVSANLLIPGFHGDPFFFEKCRGDFGRIRLPPNIRKREISELVLELSICWKFIRYFSIASVPKVIFTIVALVHAHLMKLNEQFRK